MSLFLDQDPASERPELAFPCLLARARTMDQRAVEELCLRFYPSVERKVHLDLEHDLRHDRPWLKARFSTGDVVQEVFRNVVSDLGAFGGRTEEAFVGYLSMLVRNRLIDAIRFHQAERRDGRRLHIGIEDLRLASAGVDPVESAERVEEIDRYRVALEELPERDRLLLRARTEQGCSFSTLAERFGFGCKATARRAFYAAQARLLVRLEDA